MWTMLGERPVDVFAWESFGEEWVTDAAEQLELTDCRLHVGRPYGALPDLSQARRDADIIFTQNGTTSGARIPNFDANALDLYKDPWYDPGNAHSMAWQSGITGIGYNPTLTGRGSSSAHTALLPAPTTPLPRRSISGSNCWAAVKRIA